MISALAGNAPKDEIGHRLASTAHDAHHRRGFGTEPAADVRSRIRNAMRPPKGVFCISPERTAGSRIIFPAQAHTISYGFAQLIEADTLLAHELLVILVFGDENVQPQKNVRILERKALGE